jgi:hypothetical protein
MPIEIAKPFDNLMSHVLSPSVPTGIDVVCRLSLGMQRDEKIVTDIVVV